jgi:hypothetical protein
VVLGERDEDQDAGAGLGGMEVVRQELLAGAGLGAGRAHGAGDEVDAQGRDRGERGEHQKHDDWMRASDQAGVSGATPAAAQPDHQLERVDQRSASHPATRVANAAHRIGSIR